MFSPGGWQCINNVCVYLCVCVRACRCDPQHSRASFNLMCSDFSEFRCLCKQTHFSDVCRALGTLGPVNTFMVSLENNSFFLCSGD